MGEVGIHAHNHVVVALQRPLKAGAVGRSQPLFGRAPQQRHAGIRRSARRHHIARAVRRSIVDHEHIRVRQLGQDTVEQL